MQTSTKNKKQLVIQRNGSVLSTSKITARMDAAGTIAFAP